MLNKATKADLSPDVLNDLANGGSTSVLSNVESMKINKLSDVKPLVTFIDDDGHNDVMTKLKPLFDSKGIKGCVAIISSYVGQGVYMPVSDIRTLSDAGWEILSHTVTHNDLSQMTDVEIDAELKNSKEALTNMGFNVESIAYPYGGHDSASRSLVKKHYRCGFKTGESPNTSPINSYRLNRTMTGSYYDLPNGADTLDYYKSKVDYAIANNAWVTFCTHVFATDATQLGYIGQLIDYIKSKSVDIVTVKEALDYFENVFEVRNEATGEFTIISKNGKFHSNALSDNKYKVQKPNGITASSPIESFTLDSTTVISFLNADNSGFPNGAGTLMTYRPHVEMDMGMAYQQWIPYRTKKLYQRQWDSLAGTWATWMIMEGAVPPVVILEEMNQRNVTDLISTFTSGTITHTPISTAFASANGFPENKAGLLITENTYYENGFQSQTYKLYGLRQVYERRVNSNGTWGAWHRATNRDMITSTVSIGTIPAQSTKEVLVNFPGYLLGDTVIAEPNQAIENNVLWSVYGYTDGQFYIRFVNPTAGSLTPADRTWRFHRIY